MTGGADPALLEELAQIQQGADRESSVIREEVESSEAAIIEENRQADESRKQLDQELEDRAEQHAESAGETSSPTVSSPQTPAPSGGQFGFEDDQEFQEEPVEHSASAVPPRVRHRREPQTDIDDEDEDFSQTSWLNG